MTHALYIMIEDGQRELLAKLLVAAAAAARGFDVVIGQQWLLHRNLPHIPPGIVLAKGMNKAQAIIMANARRCGHRVVANEEEALSVCDTQELLRLCDPASAAACDLILAQSEHHRSVLLAKIAHHADRIVVVGNPRIDLMRPECLGLYADEKRRIANRIGPFILINTNFGSVNSYFGDCLEYFGICVNAGVIDPNNGEDMANLATWCDWEARNFREVVALVDHLSAYDGGIRIVLRPHPTEKLDVWRAVAVDRAGVDVIRDGDHVPWTLASRLLVHTGCTTGMEAFLANHPAITLCAGDTKWHELYVSNQINPRAASGRDAGEMVRRFIAGDDMISARRPAFEAVARRYIAAVDGELSADRIVAALARVVPALRRTDGLWRPRDGFMSAIARNATQIAKFSATAEDMRAQLRRLTQALGRFSGQPIEQIGDSLFHLPASA